MRDFHVAHQLSTAMFYTVSKPVYPPSPLARQLIGDGGVGGEVPVTG